MNVSQIIVIVMQSVKIQSEVFLVHVNQVILEMDSIVQVISIFFLLHFIFHSFIPFIDLLIY